MRAQFLNQSSAQENLVLWSSSRMQKAKQKETKLFKDLKKKIQREKKTKQCAMVAFNPRFLWCSKCQQPQNYICLYTTTGFSSGLREKKKKRGEDSRIFCTFYYFCPFPQCVRKQPRNGVSLLCLLLSLFE